MPFPNEHSARIRNPGEFQKDSFRRKNIETGIDIIIGRLKGKKTTTIQSYRFKKDKFTVAQAKKWLKDHDIEYISFEPAEESKTMNKKPERRVFPIEFRQDENDKPKLLGHAAVFNQPVELYDDFIEVIESGTFKKTIERGDDVRALFNHNPNFVLGRTISETLKLWEDDIGLATEIDLPDTSQARDLLALIKRGDINQMSFAFYVTGERNEKIDGKRVRTITSVDLVDVSPVTFPAYPTTDVGLKTLSNGMEYKVGRQQIADNEVIVNVHIDSHIIDNKKFIKDVIVPDIARAISRDIDGHKTDDDKQWYDKPTPGIDSQQTDNDRQVHDLSPDGSDGMDSDKAKRAGRSASRKRKLNLADKIQRQEDKEFEIERTSRQAK